MLVPTLHMLMSAILQQLNGLDVYRGGGTLFMEHHGFDSSRARHGQISGQRRVCRSGLTAAIKDIEKVVAAANAHWLGGGASEYLMSMGARFPTTGYQDKGRPLSARRPLIEVSIPAGAPQGLELFDAIGPVLKACKTPMTMGKRDQEKAACGTDDTTESVVVSIGSNNKWNFEEAVLARAAKQAAGGSFFGGSRIQVHTYDCTMDKPATPPSFVRFHDACLGTKDVDYSIRGTNRTRRFRSWESLLSLAGLNRAPVYLKMDIEGFECSRVESNAWPPRTSLCALLLTAHGLRSPHRQGVCCPRLPTPSLRCSPSRLPLSCISIEPILIRATARAPITAVS